MLPCGIYASTNLFIKDDICIKGEIETAFGSYANREHAGVMLLDISDINSDSPFICVENADRIYGFSLLNIRIQGNYHNHVALKLVRTGWSSVITNVTISTFRNSAIYAIDAYDTFINNLTIYESGSMGLINSNPLYAIVLDGDTDVTNAWHFTNIHIEGCRYMIDFKKSRHIEIVNMKCEMASGTINGDSTNPLILKENGSYEISISSSFFIGSDIDTWRENNQSDFRPPFYIVNNDTEINLHSLIISNCTFTCLRYGMLAVKSNNNTLIENCVFELLNGEFYAIDLNGQYDKLDNCKITAVSDKNATNYPIHINNATCSNNSIILIARTTLNPGVNIAYGHAISYEGYCTITDNTITNNMREFWYFKRVSNTGKPYVKRKGLLVLTDDTLKESMGIDVISLSDNATISLNLDNIADIKTIGLQLSKTLKIDSISNGSVGEEITLFNNTVSANIITGQGLSNDRLWNSNSDVVTLG